MMAAAAKFTPVTFAVAGAVFMMARQVGAKSVRNSLFLPGFDIAQLPLMVIAASLFSLVLVFPASRATTKFTPERLVPSMFLVSAIFYGGLWLVCGRAPVGAGQPRE